MKTLYLDIFSGISGDMFIGALIDLGVDPGKLEHELVKLKLPGYRLQWSRRQKANINGVKFDVQVKQEAAHQPADTARSHQHEHPHEHGPHGGPVVKTSFGKVELSVFETNVPPRFRLYFFDSTGKPFAPVAAKTLTLETIRPNNKRQTFKFKRSGDFLEAIEELPEPHEFAAILKIRKGDKTEKHETRFIEDNHSHERESAHHSGRNFTEIRELISRSTLSGWVKQKAVAVFHRIALAEGRIHGVPPDEVQFHEVGAVDSIVDIVGACVALELLGKPRVLAAPVVEGTGWIRCAHGRFPLPAPATLAILGARGVPVTQCEEPHELITPTGAALLAEFAESFGAMQGLVATKIGYGLGTRDNQTRPNVLRAVLGKTASTGSKEINDWETDTITVIETNLDDLSGEILGHFVGQALAQGALDVFHTPVQMKKNRPGVLLTVLCAAADADKFSELVLRETSAFGLRRYNVERRKLKREFATVKTIHGEVTVKIGKLNNRVVQISPEFESCKKLAEKSGAALKQIYHAALKSTKV